MRNLDDNKEPASHQRWMTQLPKVWYVKNEWTETWKFRERLLAVINRQDLVFFTQKDVTALLLCSKKPIPDFIWLFGVWPCGLKITQSIRSLSVFVKQVFVCFFVGTVSNAFQGPHPANTGGSGLPWRRGKQPLALEARFHVPPDEPRTSPPLLPHRSSSLPPCWRGCARRQRWWPHTGVWAVRGWKGGENIKNNTKTWQAQQHKACLAARNFTCHRQTSSKQINVPPKYVQVSVCVFWGCQKRPWPQPSHSPLRCLQLERNRLAWFHSFLINFSTCWGLLQPPNWGEAAEASKLYRKCAKRKAWWACPPPVTQGG